MVVGGVDNDTGTRAVVERPGRIVVTVRAVLMVTGVVTGIRRYGGADGCHSDADGDGDADGVCGGGVVGGEGVTVVMAMVRRGL